MIWNFEVQSGFSVAKIKLENFYFCEEQQQQQEFIYTFKSHRVIKYIIIWDKMPAKKFQRVTNSPSKHSDPAGTSLCSVQQIEQASWLINAGTYLQFL